MIRFLIWRSFFEALCLLKLIGFRGRDAHYFAYGGNLDPQVMRRRAMLVRKKAVVRLPGYGLRFNHAVPFEGVGMASIEPADGESVPGLLYTLPLIDAWIMSCYEGDFVLHRYRRETATIEGVNCFFYVSNRRKEGLVPAQAYLAKVIAGYEGIMADPNDPLWLRLKRQSSISELKPLFPPAFLFTRYDALGSWFKPILVHYDRACVGVFLRFVFRPSIFDRWLQRAMP